MTEKEIRARIITALESRMKILGIKENELKDHFDLVGSGLVNSMEFVEMVGRVEDELNVELDFDSMMDDEEFTTLGRIVSIFLNKVNA
jgi:acyl carrier protein